jgi:hypothetical protein
VSIDFSKLTGWSTSRGAVTQVADSQGRIIWMLQNNKPIILEVEKITSDTYAGETTYTGEQFILLDIYPKTNGTVKVTYGGLTKTITDTSGAAKPNAQRVFFGTFNGVSDSVATPASGELVIEGSCRAFGCGSYNNSAKLLSSQSSCITAVKDWGEVELIPSYAFYKCNSLALNSLPSGITSIEDYAFYRCPNIALSSLPSGITSIGGYAFEYCPKISIETFPEGLISIGDYAFNMEKDLPQYTAMYGLNIVLPSTLQSIGSRAFMTDEVSSSNSTVHYCYLAGVKILATTPPTINDIDNPPFNNAGDFASKFRITVPKGCGDVYKTADSWKLITSFIVEAS